MHEAGRPQFAVDVVQLILIGRDDVQLDSGVFAVAARALVNTLIVDFREFLHNLDDLVFVANPRVADHLNRIINLGKFDLWRLYFGIGHGVTAS